MTPHDAMAFLRAIERGEVTLTCTEEPQDVYAGDVVYDASNGWTIIIFNDCNAWDYVDRIVSSDESVADFDTIWNDPAWDEVKRYTPDDEVAWRCYGIPGYLAYKEPRWLKT